MATISIVSLTALTVDSKCRANNFGSCISQLTLSLYLMTQCQLKLHHSVTSLAQTLDYIKVAQKRLLADTRTTLNQLTLKLTESKLKTNANALRPSVCPSVILVVCIKTVQARVTKYSLWLSQGLQFIVTNFVPLGAGVPLERGRQRGVPPPKKTTFCRYWLE